MLCTEACKALPGSARILPSNCATLALYTHRVGSLIDSCIGGTSKISNVSEKELLVITSLPFLLALTPIIAN